METTPRTINIESIGKLIIPQNVQDIIDKLHKKVGSVEWSGPLFYKITKGDFKKLKDLEFTALFIYPMDIGSHTYTEFAYNEKILPAYDLCEEALEAHRGLVHSHAGMSCFFSSTDTTELTTNASRYNFYLSLIVNFDGKYVCKIAFPSKAKSNNEYTIKDPNGKSLTFQNKKEEDVIIISDLIVETPTPVVEEGDWLDTLIAELKKPKKIEFANDYNRLQKQFTLHPYFDWNKKETKVDLTKEITPAQFLSAIIAYDSDISKLQDPKTELYSLFFEHDQGTTDPNFLLNVMAEDFDELLLEIFGRDLLKYEKKKLYQGAIEELKKLKNEFIGYEAYYTLYVELLTSKLNELQ